MALAKSTHESRAAAESAVTSKDNLDTLSLETAARVMEATPVVMHFIRSRLKERPALHPSVPQVRVMAFIEKHPGCSLTHLSEFLAITSASASTMIERLVRGGYVDRIVDPLKRRKVILHLTPHGRNELLAARRLAVEAISVQLSKFDRQQLKTIEESMTLLKSVFSTVYGAMDDDLNVEPDINAKNTDQGKRKK